MEDGDVIEKGAGYRPRKLVISVPRDGVRGRWGRGEPCRWIGVDEDGQNRKVCVVLFSALFEYHVYLFMKPHLS